MEDKIRMTFGFSSISYTSHIFGRGLDELRNLRLLEGSKVCYCQHWELVLVLVDFQNKLLQYKLLVYILSRVVVWNGNY